MSHLHPLPLLSNPLEVVTDHTPYSPPTLSCGTTAEMFRGCSTVCQGNLHQAPAGPREWPPSFGLGSSAFSATSCIHSHSKWEILKAFCFLFEEAWPEGQGGCPGTA